MTCLTESTLLLLALLGDLLTGNFFLVFSFALYVALYYSVSVSGYHGAVGAAAAGLMLDLIYLRPFCISAPVLLIALAAGHRISHLLERSIPWAPLAAGAAAGALAGGGSQLGLFFCGRSVDLSELFTQMGAQFLFGGFFFLFLVLLLDHLGHFAGFPLYAAELPARQPNRQVRRVGRREL